jgi:hypothetical protein
MFRKLLAIETEALRQDAAARDRSDQPTDRELSMMARELSRCVPAPTRFGLCGSRPRY